MDIGEKIQLLRKEKQMTQNMVAEVLHVSTQAVSNWERGKGYPDIQNILQLSDLFDVSLDELIKEDVDFKDALLTKKVNGWMDLLFYSLTFVIGLLCIGWQISKWVTGGFQQVSVFVFAVGIMFGESCYFWYKRRLSRG